MDVLIVFDHYYRRFFLLKDNSKIYNQISLCLVKLFGNRYNMVTALLALKKLTLFNKCMRYISKGPIITLSIVLK